MHVRLLIIIISIFCCLQLAGCAAGVFAAGGATGGAVAADSRSIAQKTRDQSLQQQIGTRIYRDPQLHDDAQIVIAVFDNDVLLAGQARTQALRAQAEKYAYSVKGVARVYNQMTLGDPISAWTQTQDAWLTTKVKSKLLATKGVAAGYIKVVSDNSIVYLFGHVTQAQADLAAKATSEVGGVRQVVTLFRDVATDEGITTKSV